MQAKPLPISKEDLERTVARRNREEASRPKASTETMFIAEFGMYFGWQAIVDMLNDKVTMKDAKILLESAKRVKNNDFINLANVYYIAAAAAQSKRGQTIMREGLKDFIKNSRADNG